MILACNYEELRALRTGATTLREAAPEDPCIVAAPPAGISGLDLLVPQLDGDLVIDSLAEQRVLQAAVGAVVECLRIEMESLVSSTHPAHEVSVAAYFDFAHALSVLRRLREIGAEMEALIEVDTGSSATDETAQSFRFLD